MIKTTIVDGAGSGMNARIMDEQALLVTMSAYPPLLQQKVVVFRQFMTDDGLSTGDEDMRVDGSSTPVDFWIPAVNVCDRYITALSFVIADISASLSKFGAITALTNGCKLFYNNHDVITIHDTLKSNFDFIRLCIGSPAWGTTTPYRAPNVIGASDAYFPVLDLRALIPPFGIKLNSGTKQRLVLQVRDNTTGVDAFDVIAYGFDRYP